VGLKSTPIRVACGTASVNISKLLLATRSVSRTLSPVMLPPGCAKLATCRRDGVGVVGEDDGDCLGSLSGGLHLGRRRREYDVDIHADQLGCQLRQLVDPFRPAKLNDNVLALDIAEIAQPRPQRLDPISVSRSKTETQEPDPRNLRRLLAPRAVMATQPLN